MSQTRAVTHTAAVADQYGQSLCTVFAAAASAVADGQFRQGAILAERIRAAGEHLLHGVVRDALIAGADWWTLGDALSMHPQAAFDRYANLIEGTMLPAQQRPDLAVVCTAGLPAVHDMEPEYGIDLDDLAPNHSLTLDPTVVRLRAAAKLLGEDVWITVTPPGDFEGAEGDPDEEQAITQWTTVAVHPDGLAWLREALALNAERDVADDEDDDLEPLD